MCIPFTNSLRQRNRRWIKIVVPLLLILMPFSSNCSGQTPHVIANDDEVLTTCFSPDGSVLGAAIGGKITLWKTADWEHVATLTGHANDVLSLAILDNDGRRIVSGGDDYVINLWDRTAGRSFPYETRSRHIALSPCRGFLAVANSAKKTDKKPLGNTLVLKVTSGSKEKEEKEGEKKELMSRLEPWKDLPGHKAGYCSFSNNGKMLAAGGFDNGVEIWDWKSGKKALSLKVDQGADDPEIKFRAFCISFSPDDSLIAAASSDGHCRVWNLNTKELVATWSVKNSGGMSSVVFLPDGTSLVSGSADGVIRVWKIGKKSPIREISAHKGIVWSLAVSFNARLLSSGGEDKMLKVWRFDALTDK